MVTGVEQQLQELGKQNGATIGRLLATGNVGYAEEGPDGRMHATVRIPLDELVFDPGVLVMPHGGELELEIINDDNNTHCAVLPSNGDSQVHLAGELPEGNGHPQARRPGLLLVRLADRQRRGRRPDRHDRREGRRPDEGQARPSTPAAPVERSS